MVFPPPLFGGLFLGWALGANDSANVFGTAVAARIVSYTTATLLCAIAVIAGALLQGESGIETYRGLAGQSVPTLVVCSVAAAFTVTLMTFFKLPISTSQAMVGAIAGIGLATDTMNWGGLQKVVICWLLTPVGALVCAVILYWSLALFFTRVSMSMLTRDRLLWAGLIVTGLYGSYALGANNVANATGIFSEQFEGFDDQLLCLIGGSAIALGAITYSYRVMMSVGSGIMPLDAFTALVAVGAMAVTVHVFAMLGVPVSTSQAIVGAILGIGTLKGVHSIRFRLLRNIAVGWLLTPTVSLVLASSGWAIFV